MSATGRSPVRRPGDAYFTPRWVTALVVPFMPELLDEGASVLDPAAGTGALIDGLREAGATCWFDGIELDAASAELYGDPIRQGDALDPATAWRRPSAVVMNPPFGAAEEFLQRAMAETRRGGTVAMLGRLGFLASKRRVEALRAFPPDVYVLSRRPSFTGGGTDSADYAWFIWRAGVRRERGTLEVLACPER